MAEIGQKLPKWQAQQILCQTSCQIGIGEKITASIFPLFFSCKRRYTMYDQGKERLG
jgi:hypothetical protein